MTVMAKSFKPATWLLLALTCAAPALAQPSAANLRTNDAALIRHIKATDFVFQALLGKCEAGTLQRNIQGGLSYFTYKAVCAIRPRPEADCQRYRVTAMGTVDTPDNATVRDIRLKLLCTA
jgi:hypothetical protein